MAGCGGQRGHVEQHQAVSSAGGHEDWGILARELRLSAHSPSPIRGHCDPCPGKMSSTRGAAFAPPPPPPPRLGAATSEDVRRAGTLGDFEAMVDGLNTMTIATRP